MLAPITGSPEAVRLLADRLATGGDRLAAMAGVLGPLRDGAVWDGPAGEAFGQRVLAVPAVLDAAARRLLGAVAPLRLLADALEDAQRLAAAAGREHTDAEDWYARLEERAWSLASSGVQESDPALLAVRALQREHAATMHRARTRHAAATELQREADRRCAAALRRLVDDGLADPWGYRGLHAASRVGHDVGYVGTIGGVTPAAKGVGLVGEAAGTTADAALLAVYGEGSWSGLGASAALSGSAFLGRGLVAGAGHGARIGVDGVEVLRRLSARERVLAGAASEARRRVSALRRTFDVTERATPSALVGGPALRRSTAGGLRGGLAAARVRVRAGVDAGFLDDWRLATANGTRPMYASGVTLQAAAAGGRTVVERRRPGR